MSPHAIRIWYILHKWSSIVATLFLLMLCVTGLPLIFHDEIDALGSAEWELRVTDAPSATEGIPLDRIVSDALASQPGDVPLFIGFSQDNSLITVTTGPTPDAPGAEMTLLYFDRATGAALGPVERGGIMDVILDLHIDMLLGQFGMFFLGAMGILFLFALVSGVALYAPFMRRLKFGTLRTGRSKRVGRLDQHNLIGIVTLAWALVVGATGAINAFADPLTEDWRSGEVADMTAAYDGTAALAPDRYGSIDAAMASAHAALPGLSPQFVGFPGGAWSSGHHYAIFFQGATPLTANLLTPALVDAETGRLTDSRIMPVANQALMMSKPLHFGDYGGLPLKLAWALLDLATIWVLVTGVLLWLKSGPAQTEKRITEIASGARRWSSA